jgi:aldose 1-epimerase
MISIGSGTATVSVDADHGGRIAALAVAGRQMLIGPAPERGPMHWGSYPMVPWVGRVRRGRFVFGGRQHDLPLDMPPHAIHGTGYRQPWHVESVADNGLSMSCALDWDFGGRAWQRIDVEATHVTCLLGVAAGDDVMPAEIGWHPWFVKSESLSFRPASMYVRDDDGIPSGELVSPPPGPWDDCFINTAPVELRYEELTITIESDCDHWVVYDQLPHATCAEPQSGPPDAFNIRPRTLEPGQQLVRTMTISWKPRVAAAMLGDRHAAADARRDVASHGGQRAVGVDYG